MFEVGVGFFGMRESLLLESAKSLGARQTVGAARELSTLDVGLFV